MCTDSDLYFIQNYELSPAGVRFARLKPAFFTAGVALVYYYTIMHNRFVRILRIRDLIRSKCIANAVRTKGILIGYYEQEGTRTSPARSIYPAEVRFLPGAP